MRRSTTAISSSCISNSTTGTSSLAFGYEVRADGAVAATGETTQVFMGEEGTPTPLPDQWRETIEQFEPALSA
jgi:acyl-CoA thioester hydrolase